MTTNQDSSADPARVLCVTGGGAGIGRGIVLHFAALGWRVAAIDRDKAALAEIAAMLPRESLLTVVADVGRESAVRRAAARVAAWAGRVDCLVNNAGVADPRSGPLGDLTLEAWRGWIDASLTAAFLVTREVLPLLEAAAPSCVVNIASTRALQSEPDTFAYAAAKGGLVALTHAMAVSLGPSIRANAVLPGWIETAEWQRADRRSVPRHSHADEAQHPAGRVGTVADVAAAVEYLAGPGAGFVTGASLVVDGGMTRRMIYAA